MVSVQKTSVLAVVLAAGLFFALGRYAFPNKKPLDLFGNFTTSQQADRSSLLNTPTSTKPAELEAKTQPSVPTPPPPQAKSVKEEATGCASCKDGLCYGVQYRDTLSAISLRFYHSVKESKLKRIADANQNHITGPDYKIYAETCICLPGVRKLVPRRNVAPKSHVVQAAPVQTPAPSAPVQVVVPAPAPAPAPVVVVAAPTAPAPVVVVPAPAPAPAPPVQQNIQQETRLVIKVPQQGEPPSNYSATPAPLPLPRTQGVNIEKSTILPGSIWSSTGNVSPVERGNIISYTNVEQGVTLWHSSHTFLVPYVSDNVAVDSKGYDWNNRNIAQAGIKLVQRFDHGVIQGGGGYAQEYRFKSGLRASQPFLSASDWFGWDQPTNNKASRPLFSAFPGSTWAVVGNTSPIEKNNIIGLAYLQQGTTLTKVGRVSVIPYGEVTYGRDTKKLDWNNKRVLGAGLKLSIPVGTGVIEPGVLYRDENRWLSGSRARGTGAYVNFSIGWNPPVSNERR